MAWKAMPPANPKKSLDTRNRMVYGYRHRTGDRPRRPPALRDPAEQESVDEERGGLR